MDNVGNMTLVDLHNILGEQIQKLRDVDNLPKETHRKVLDSAMAISSLSKQMINNADVILRAQKLVYDKKMPHTSAISMMIEGASELGVN